MQTIPFTRDVLNQTDEELGITLIAYWVGIFAEMAGIEDLDAIKDLAAVVIKRTAEKDGDSVEFAALESIYRKACRGDLALAGRMFRDYVARNDIQFALEEHARVGAKSIEDRKKGGKKRAANDPKQAAKAEARKLWLERHAGKHRSLRTNEQFAMECMRRWPVLTSTKVICGWCTAWNKEFKKS